MSKENNVQHLVTLTAAAQSKHASEHPPLLEDVPAAVALHLQQQDPVRVQDADARQIIDFLGSEL
jgi:hypothetical protein